MPQISRAKSRYQRQRARVTPPHVSLGDFRAALGLTIDEVRQLLADKAELPKVTRGAISAIENGHRGVSDDLLRGLEIAYDLPVGALTTEYRPRAAKASAA